MIEALRRALADPTNLVRRALGVPALERDTLIAIVSFSALLLLFAVVAEAVIVGGTHDLDRELLLALREPADVANPIGPAWLEEAMRDISAMGSTAVLAFIIVALILFNLGGQR